VAIVEQGRRLAAADLEAGKRSLAKLMWVPAIGWRGYFVQHFFRHVGIVGGIGVGGGSIVWAAVMLEPKPAFYEDVRLKELGLDLRKELAPHFASAKRMLGSRPIHFGVPRMSSCARQRSAWASPIPSGRYRARCISAIPA
jgi:cholesterol oxidase